MSCDIITIGSATMDVFVECDDANIVSVRKKDSNAEYMSYPYGSKIEITDFDSKVGGGGVNTATNFANLGFDTGAIFKVGDDIYSKGIFEFFKWTKVDVSSVIQDEDDSTGFSIILTSFEGDRTVLAHRGANAHIRKSEIDFDAIRKAKLLYIAPLNGESNKVLDGIVKFAKENDTYVCFNAGTTGIKKGFSYLKNILEYAQIVVLNKEEASMATNITLRSDTKDVKYSNHLIHPDLKEMFKKLKVSDYQVIVITDGGAGAYAYDGKKYYYCPCFKGPVMSTLGAGDAFASTFCAALYKFKGDIEKSLVAASINSAGVVSKFGATEGLLTFDEIIAKMDSAPEFKCSVSEV
ncbi:MAG: carbohydrate kinase family protein [Muribaculaceae bacterium]|nr:carbohydrate kinase family protein [Muribaculaceae bacterium]